MRALRECDTLYTNDPLYLEEVKVNCFFVVGDNLTTCVSFLDLRYSFEYNFIITSRKDGKNCENNHKSVRNWKYCPFLPKHNTV